MDAADTAAAANKAATKEKREQQEKQAKFELAKAQIASQIQGRANEIHSVWTTHYLPQELATLAEICSEPDVLPNIALVSQRAAAEVAKTFAMNTKIATYGVSPQHIGVRAEIAFDMATKHADLLAGVTMSQVQAERRRVDLVNKQNRENRMNIINAGRNNRVGVESGLKATAAMYSDLSKDAADAIGKAGYVQGRAISSLVTQGEEILKGKNEGVNWIRGQDWGKIGAPSAAPTRDSPTLINIQTDSLRERQTQNDAYGEADQYRDKLGDDNG
jgi:hypothetical protein